MLDLNKVNKNKKSLGTHFWVGSKFVPKWQVCTRSQKLKYGLGFIYFKPFLVLKLSSLWKLINSSFYFSL